MLQRSSFLGAKGMARILADRLRSSGANQFCPGFMSALSVFRVLRMAVPFRWKAACLDDLGASERWAY